MKRIICLLMAILMVLLFSSCSTTEVELPSGKASNIRIQEGADWRGLGSGIFEYIDETTIKYIRERDQKTFLVSTANLIYIEVEHLDVEQ